MIWAFFAVAVIVLLPLGAELSRKKMGPSTRAHAPGEFAQLSQGVTHYQWYGPQDGQTVLCIHGLTTPSFVWRSLADGLAKKGYHVLTYDLYGRGFSDRLSGTQDKAFFLRQLNDLLGHQGVKGDITVIGYSMGGVIATAFADTHTERVRELILLAPAGIKTRGFGLLRRISLIPVIGYWLMLAVYPGILRRGINSEAGLPVTVEDINGMQLAEMGWRGFIPSVHASIKGILTDNFETAHRKLHDLGLPVMVIWGRQDDVIPIEASELLRNWNPDVETHIIDDAGHAVTYSHTNIILEHIIRFATSRG